MPATVQCSENREPSLGDGCMKLDAGQSKQFKVNFFLIHVRGVESCVQVLLVGMYLEYLTSIRTFAMPLDGAHSKWPDGRIHNKAGLDAAINHFSGDCRPKELSRSWSFKSCPSRGCKPQSPPPCQNTTCGHARQCVSCGEPRTKSMHTASTWSLGLMWRSPIVVRVIRIKQLVVH